MISNLIKGHLIEYIRNMQSIKINEDYDHIVKKYNSINTEANDLIMNNTKILHSIINNGGLQYGGEMKIDDIKIAKLKKIASLFSEFRALKIDDAEENVKAINAKTQEILGIIDSVKIPDNKDQLVSPTSILNSLENLKVSLVKFNNQLGTNTTMLTKKDDIEIPVENIIKEPDSILKNIKKHIDSDISLLSTSIDATGTTDETKINDLIANIKDNIKIIQKAKNEMTEANNKMKIAESTFFKNIMLALRWNGKFLTGKSVTDVEPIDMTIIDDKDLIIVDSFDKFLNAVREKYIHVLAHVKTKIEDLLKSYDDKKISEDKFGKNYNEIVNGLSDEELKGLPKRCFDGKFTRRIDSNIITNGDITIAQMSAIKDMLIVKDVDEEYVSVMNSKDHPDVEKTFDHIYSPDFSIMKGGSIREKMSELHNVHTEYSKEINEYYKTRNEYVANIKKYNRYNLQNITHTLYVLLIVTNKLFTNGFVVYKYINKGILQLYKRILDGMINKINQKKSSDEMLYLKKYHFVTIIKLNNFINILIQRLNASPKPNLSLIDIESCKGKVSEIFLLFNYFKSTLETFNELYQNKVTIYSRINDIPTAIDHRSPKFLEQKMFMSDQERFNRYVADNNNSELSGVDIHEQIKSNIIDNSIMWVRKKACSSLSGDEPEFSKYRFTEVFDTSNFPYNNDISKYMTLDTQLSKGKGVCMITYGYSGTGKTYTLFGGNGRDGILQATLNNINGLSEVKFRLYEVYGIGLPYPNYWMNEIGGGVRLDDIYNEIYHYKLLVEQNEGMSSLIYDKTQPTETFKSNKIGDYINDNSKYFSIGGNLAEEIFKNFNKFMDTVETHRKSKLRVRETPNNKVSSRSVLIYDFMLKVKGIESEVPFLIIDLPGREEITKTYVEPYIDNIHISKIITDNYVKTGDSAANRMKPEDYLKLLKLLIASMTLNPLAIPSLLLNNKIAKDIIINMINSNNEYKKDIWEIIETELSFNFEYSTERSTIMGDRTASVMQQEKYNIEGDPKGTTGKITGVLNADGSVRGFKMYEEMVNRFGNTMQHFYNISDRKFNRLENKKGFGYTNDDQINAMLSIHLINRLILLKRFDILKTIYEKITECMINKYITVNDTDIPTLKANLQATNFKGEYLNDDSDDIKFIDKIKFNYYLTGLEGVYINENIIGLIKYLSSNESIIRDATMRKEFLEKNINKQNNKLNFQYQQKVARRWLMSKDPDNAANLAKFFNLDSAIPNKLLHIVDSTNVYISDALEAEYKSIEKSYKSDAIFSFDEPLIQKIMDRYFKSIKDYKVFYLFANYNNSSMGELKCANQNKLLKNTNDFMKSITNESAV